MEASPSRKLHTASYKSKGLDQSFEGMLQTML